MKRWLSSLLLIILLSQALPLNAMAAIGKVLTQEELAAAYTLTGLSNEAAAARSNAVYHKGMKPNATWNAMQISDWLDDVLSTDMNNVEDILSRASVAMARLKESNPTAYQKLSGGDQTSRTIFNDLQQMYRDAEAVREEMRYAKDFLEERAGLIAELGRQLEEDGGGMFSSERVRLSAKIETAAKELDAARGEIAQKADGWTSSIQNWNARLGLMTEGASDRTPGWFEELYSYDEGAMSNTAPVVAVNASNSRLGKLSSGASVLDSNASKATVFVLSENQIAIEMYTGKDKKQRAVPGVEVTVKDLSDPYAQPITRITDEKGRIVLMSNEFMVDDNKKINVSLDVEAEAVGFRSYGIEEQKIKLGQAYKGTLVPLDDKPYIYSASFHGYDILTQDFKMLFSELIDVDFDIVVKTRNPGGEGRTPALRFAYWKKGDGFSGMGSTPKKHFVDATIRNGNTFTFRGPWKKNIVPWLSKDHYPYFTFDGADKDESLRTNSRLITMKSAVDYPLEKGSLVFAKVMKEGFSFKIDIDILPFPSAIKVDLPIKDFLPQVSVNLGGFVTIYIGSPVMRDKLKQSSLNFKNQELVQLEARQREVEQKNWLANQKAQYGVAYNYYMQKKTTVLRESKISVGVFMLMSGRWVLDNTVEDVKAFTIAYRAGSGVLAKYSYSWVIRWTLGPVPMHLTLIIGVSAGFEISYELAFCWVNGGFENWSIKPIKDFTIVISVSFTAQFGVGIKDFCEIWGRFVSIFEFRLHYVLMGQEMSTFTGYLYLSVTAGVTLFIATWSMDLWSFDFPLFSPIPIGNGIPPLQQYTLANAEPEEERASTQEPMSYPGLVPTAKQVKLSGSDPRATTRVGVIDGQTYLFYLAKVTGKDKQQHMRLCWVNVNDNSKTGSTQTAIDAWDTSLNGRGDYAFDVQVVDGYVFLLVACAAQFDSNGNPKPNANLTSADQCNQLFYVSMLQSNGKGNLTATLKKGYYRTGYQYNIDGSVSRDNQLVDHLLVKAAPVGYVEDVENRLYYYDSIDNPEITWAKVMTDKRVSECAGVEIFGTFGRVVYSDGETPYGITSFELLPITGSGSALIPGSEGVKCFTDEFVGSGMGENYVRIEARGAMRCSNTQPKVHDSSVDHRYSPGFLALSQPKDGGEGDRAIELFDFEMNGVRYGGRQTIVLEKGDIEHIELAQVAENGDGTNYRRMVFYTAKETSDDGDEHSRLYGLYLEPLQRDGRELTIDVTKYTYDLTVPAETRFNLAYIGDTPYLYWLTSAPKEKEEDPDAFRIMISAYDISTNTMTDPAVYAEFQLPQYRYSRTIMDRSTLWVPKTYATDLNLVPQSVILTGTGTAYLSAVGDVSTIQKLIEQRMVPKSFMPDTPPVALYSFPVQMKPLMELKDLFFEDSTVCVGEFEDVTVAMMNTGNMGIAKFDLEVYTLEDGKANVAETIHADCFHPERSTLTMKGSDKAEELPEDAPVMYRDSDFDYTARQRDWVLENVKKQYHVTVGSSVQLDSVETVDSDAQFIKTDMLMPGAMASFSGTVKIPANWSGDTTLYMRVSKISTYSNWVRAMANAAGAKNNGVLPNAAQPEELTWVLDEESGRMVLQTGQISPNGFAANAVRSGIIANAMDAPDEIAIAVADQDIEVDHRIYSDGEGGDLVDIIISNYTATDDSFKLTCAVYLDQEKEPYYVNLPYYDTRLADRRTHTITMPVSALVPDMDSHYQARVIISAVDRDECAIVNNEFTVQLGGTELRITEQPVSQTVQEGEDVSFRVGVGGGTKPYRYRWQMWDEKHKKWVDLPGFTEPTMSRKDIEKKWDGCKFRCIITDASGAQVTTVEVTLKVRDEVPTGDNSNLPLYLAAALAALALLWLVRRRMGRAS